MNHLTSIATTANTEQSNQHVQTHTTIKKHYFFKVPGIMKLLLSITAAALLIVPQTMVVAYSFPSAPTTTTTNNRDTATTQTHMHWTTRRTALASLVTAVLGTTTQVAHASDSSIAGGSSSSGSTSNSKNEAVYFGVGCFWHIQHELVQAERDLLKRSDRELTSVTGYAGGRAAGSAGRVCYHNFQRVADYGKLGHGEVVGLQLPTDKIVEFAAVYFSLFNPKTLDRVDPLNRGGEYRSLIGLPGGTSHPVYPAVVATAAKAGFRLEVGKGDDPDTLGRKLVYVYDTAPFPFYQAEVYHQYHDDFQSPPYGKAYNKLADLAFEEGRIHTTGCPDRV